jgi:hypothetical protein
LQPRIAHAELFAIETVNADDYGEDEVERLRGKQFGDLLPKLLVPNMSAIVDVGSSNAEALVQRLVQYGNAHTYIDFFVIPVAPKPKMITDTKVLIDTLARIGVPASKIRVLFNMVDTELDTVVVFKILFDHARETKSFVINEHAVLYENELYPKLNGTGLTIPILLDPTNDIEAALMETEDEARIGKLTQQLAARLLAEKTNCELDAAFTALLS